MRAHQDSFLISMRTKEKVLTLQVKKFHYKSSYLLLK